MRVEAPKMSKEKDTLAKELLAALDANLNLIRAGFSQVQPQGSPYHKALDKVVAAHSAWKDAS